MINFKENETIEDELEEEYDYLNEESIEEEQLLNMKSKRMIIAINKS